MGLLKGDITVPLACTVFLDAFFFAKPLWCKGPTGKHTVALSVGLLSEADHLSPASACFNRWKNNHPVGVFSGSALWHPDCSKFHNCYQMICQILLELLDVLEWGPK